MKDRMINENLKLVLLTLLYLSILFALFWIYAGGSVENNFIYNEF
ncbi:teichoic acid D-Ala incorporation-associated protein DltX [Macrococcoides canis]|nr:teichoic acid D-Ala incorporation-associated protein DltX [Macrococcus canis]QTQ08834.1 teichoic acid D-Ala incorporation-associated protein DltX [Macrococcus canis]QUR93928.1 teichoic acid D-Ala incorporation-associated protein DltX [Macrococcus canis]UTH07548.1 teichoic acid D-Ala incorporation-associated protein DltX [Macrococcus canis]